jgi:hypothetical protein
VGELARLRHLLTRPRASGPGRLLRIDEMGAITREDAEKRPADAERRDVNAETISVWPGEPRSARRSLDRGARRQHSTPTGSRSALVTARG